MSNANKSDFHPIGASNAMRCKASSTEMVGGSWSRKLLDSNTLTYTPAFDRAESGKGIQDFSRNIGRSSSPSYWQNHQFHNVIWPIAANDTAVDIRRHSHNLFHNLMAVGAWVAGDGPIWQSETGTADANYPNSRIEPSSAEGSGLDIPVKGKPGWYVLILLTNGTREIEGKIVEGDKRIDINWDSAAFSARPATEEGVGLPYYSQTGVFDVELWTSMASGYGVCLGVREMENPHNFAIFQEDSVWNMTAEQSAERHPIIDNTITNFLTAWEMMGGGAYRGILPTSGYMMADSVHIDDSNQTAWMHAQWLEQILT